MLRHFKMEIKRQQQLEDQTAAAGQENALTPVNQQQVFDAQQVIPMSAAPRDIVMHTNQLKQQQQVKSVASIKQQRGSTGTEMQPKRVRGRRSSKPLMEKRRRARINECLDILKSYVLTDSANLTRLGIDTTASENQDEETIARTILKSSGLINRHRGRKNPNKLEKADILELTVDYVSRLHEQRDELLARGDTFINQISTTTSQQMQGMDQHYVKPQQTHQQQLVSIPAHLNQPLTLDLSPKSRQQLDLSPPTPPPSSASSSPNGEMLQGVNSYKVSQMILSRVLKDNYGMYELAPY